MAMIIPPIKSQGIKTKLVPWINDLVCTANLDSSARWFEPFFGTGVVGFNSLMNNEHIVGDTNPYIIDFYRGVQEGQITAYSMREYLEKETVLLQNGSEDGYEYYRIVRDRFNKKHSPYDFIFLSRAGFNGMMRFNRKGEWNIPFCKKSDRFSPAYITKICNQVGGVSKILTSHRWRLQNVSFETLIEQAEEKDIIYCDPPYHGRYVDYYNGWTEKDEERLYHVLRSTKAKFILSTWHHNDYRKNEMLSRYWGDFNVITREHFYHNGGKIENRHAMIEALVYNFEISDRRELQRHLPEPSLFSDLIF
jgi:DNA adenine methylase